jgi:preprotein translocase subunit SecG
MEQVVLTIHLILALCLIVVVLLQRSEGGALGIGGGGGGLVTGRGVATALSKMTWVFAVAFITTSLTLTVLAAQGRRASAVIGAEDPASEAPAGLSFTPALPQLDDGPALPRLDDGPMTPPAGDEAPAQQ